MARRYSQEFKREAVRLYHESDKGFRTLGQELGVSAYSLRKWAQEAAESASPQAREESEELKRLRKENRVLREEREVF